MAKTDLHDVISDTVIVLTFSMAAIAVLYHSAITFVFQYLENLETDYIIPYFGWVME